MPRILVLGGTSEASRLARALAERGDDAIFSYAGRTASPVAQPLPMRVGGFGGVDGLAAYLRAEKIEAVIDATHPFAAQMTANAVRACAQIGVPLAAFERPPWQAGPDDNWRHVPDLAAAAAALPDDPVRVFLAIGKQNLDLFADKAQHHYLVRLVDPPEGELPFVNVGIVIARGPFEMSADQALMRDHRIDIVIAKNSGGSGARAKLDAARALGLPVVMIDRPEVPARTTCARLEDILHWLDHSARLGV
ncbi:MULTISPECIES: cobalt-precorrin-6A reductase [unclassified Roseovarius]|uniref:cobalt-precorrin-6A reductase n=1 Tax=unclassified Roseovarius TaxID=2614913 RepID=UPI00273E7037|nr:MULTISPECIES: cobalt-precorrin-6A reductase [unclassified Roseovarius]